MKKFVSIIFLIILIAGTILSGCKKEGNGIALLPKQNETIISKEDINKNSILPEALEYYKNIATMANWYFKHPQIREQSSLKNTFTDSINPLLLKLEQLPITDSLDEKISIFDLDQAELDTFLTSFVWIESKLLSDKLKLLQNTNGEISSIQNTNNAFRTVFSNKKSLEQVSSDPYWKISMQLTRQEKLLERNRIKLSTSNTGFWWKVITNYALRYTVFHIAPNSLSRQTFVDRIRSSIHQGRLLIALPGGFTTSYPIVFYPNEEWYDVGHVAIMLENAANIPQQIPDHNFYFTIGTNPTDGMDYEKKLEDDWCNKHGVAYVGVVFKVKWVWFKENWHHWGWKKKRVDQDTNVFNEALNIKDTPYCKWYEVTTAKWTAPKRFICSSTAWWCAKKGAGVNISSWWKTTIFPAGVFLSDRVRIIDNTLY